MLSGAYVGVLKIKVAHPVFFPIPIGRFPDGVGGDDVLGRFLGLWRLETLRGSLVLSLWGALGLTPYKGRLLDLLIDADDKVLDVVDVVGAVVPDVGHAVDVEDDVGDVGDGGDGVFRPLTTDMFRFTLTIAN